MIPPVSEETGRRKPPAPRVVLLGASNLTRGFAVALGTARGILGPPIEVMAALGHGRSYGSWSRFLGRGLPGIVECGLWEALRRRPPAPTYALLTDIGNDILYEAPVPAIAGWIEWCLDRLAEAGARTVLTLLPAAGIEALDPRLYLVLRGVLFPGRRLRLSQAVERTRELNLRLVDLARGRGIPLVSPEAAWYGIDPIHVKRRLRREAWTRILGGFRSGDGPPTAAGIPLRLRLELRFLAPELRRLAGFERRREQPSRRLSDGSTVAVY